MMSPLAHDLGQHLQEQVGDVLQRHLKVAQAVLDQKELALILVQVAVSTVLTTAATCCSVIDEEQKRAAFFDDTIDMVAGLARGNRDRSLAKVAQKIAGDAA